MAARLDPDHVGRTHQSLHHLVAEAPWDDELLLDRALDTVLPAMVRQGPIVAWVVDDTGFPKKAQHSVVWRASTADRLVNRITAGWL